MIQVSIQTASEIGIALVIAIVLVYVGISTNNMLSPVFLFAGLVGLGFIVLALYYMLKGKAPE